MSLGSLTLSPIKRISGKVDLPGSKSLSNRVLLLSMLAEGTTHIRNLLDSDDVRYMIGALEQLGIRMEETRESNEIRVEGCAAKIPNSDLELMLGNAGTAMRPLTAALTLGSTTLKRSSAPRCCLSSVRCSVRCSLRKPYASSTAKVLCTPSGFP
ncbi:MAG: hypothetical protein CL937_01955, partial [Deltaproteobacteria bacterium]